MNGWIYKEFDVEAVDKKNGKVDKISRIGKEGISEAANLLKLVLPLVLLIVMATYFFYYLLIS